MLDLQKDTHLLFYNVFGVAIITEDRIIVSLNIHKDGKIHGRTLRKELDTRLSNVSIPIMLPFGAWVQEDQIYFTPGRLEAYDMEAYEVNKEVIDGIINSALGLVRGAVSR